MSTKSDSSGQLSSRREVRERSTSRQIRETTVVSQPGRLSISSPRWSERTSRIHASCTASSAAWSLLSMRRASPRRRGRSASNLSASTISSVIGHILLGCYVNRLTKHLTEL